MATTFHVFLVRCEGPTADPPADPPTELSVAFTLENELRLDYKKEGTTTLDTNVMKEEFCPPALIEGAANLLTEWGKITFEPVEKGGFLLTMTPSWIGAIEKIRVWAKEGRLGLSPDDLDRAQETREAEGASKGR